MFTAHPEPAEWVSYAPISLFYCWYDSVANKQINSFAYWLISCFRAFTFRRVRPHDHGGHLRAVHGVGRPYVSCRIVPGNDTVVRCRFNFGGVPSIYVYIRKFPRLAPSFKAERAHDEGGRFGACD